MKNILSLLLLVFLVVSCKNEPKATEVETTEVTETESQEVAYASFGEKIEADDAVSMAEMSEKFKAMQVGDSTAAKLVGKVNEVCQAKGCWMRVDLGNDEEVMVKFKDYGFFMPKNIAGKDVIMRGQAYVSEVSVEEQRHYAEDAGKSEEEIAAITEPKRTYSFMADGVLLIEE
ncbi:DUF4920 domain-containing protein [Hanstruepera neustonica]|uniref:DUF4920 domain-containing protein n=1 Tax=Hanstruepera neustonica TaxID=1445657 RepID=A0A2K1DZB2_9FLAO|nr:DUF4920 domain-containing protein [Hanstruepera neustonica]PNQ73366.1 DUF4920 domain-containing protein [Hanstruepera neustonica]